MNERDAYMLANALVDALSGRKRRFHCATVPRGIIAVMLISEGPCLCGFVSKK
jgi:hypothetical protein